MSFLIVLACLAACVVEALRRSGRRSGPTLDLGASRARALPGREPYAALLRECLDRQPYHEAEHQHRHRHGGEFSDALRVQAIARRLERKIDEAGLPAVPYRVRLKMAEEALCRPRI